MSCDCGSNLSAAFRSAHQDQAYIFLKNKYVVDDYKPAQSGDKILYGPTLNREGFPALKCTIFGEYGVDCAFASHDVGQAFLFAFNDCALFDYAPYSNSERLIKGPMPIAEMFPFLKGTVFEQGVDAAFESSVKYEAYLFKGDQYARINYSPTDGRLMNTGTSSRYFPCFKGTVFESGIGAAFASHRPNEAYLFKGELYGRLKFTPGKTEDEFLGPVHKIKDSWPELSKLLTVPKMNAN